MEKEGGKRQREQVMREKERQAGVSDSDRDSPNAGCAAASTLLRTTWQHPEPLASLVQSRVLMTTVALAGQSCPAKLCPRPSLI